MKFVKTFICLAAMISLNASAGALAAQETNSAVQGTCNGDCGGVSGSCVPVGDCSTRPGVSCPTACNGVGPEGYCIGCTSNCGGRYLGARGLALAAGNKYSPAPVYSYSHRGLDATRMHQWNWRQAGNTSWHGGHNYWLYGQPTALVVPPTAAFQSEYNWGVAQTRSMPINHQFNRNYSGGGGVAGGGAFRNTPYWPSSTNQFGIYPVRGPW